MVKSLFETLYLQLFVNFTIGETTQGAARSIKLILPNIDAAQTPLRGCSPEKLQPNNELSSVSISRDRTQKEIKPLVALRAGLEARVTSGDKECTIEYVNGILTWNKIVKTNSKTCLFAR
jgi:hypothetical protein